MEKREFILKINWFERKAPCFRVQGMTFRANRGVNFIIKIYENDSGRKFHSPSYYEFHLKKQIELSGALFCLIMIFILVPLRRRLELNKRNAEHKEL